MRASWTLSKKRWMFGMVFLGFMVLARLNSNPASNTVIRVANVREIYNAGIRNISDLHLDGSESAATNATTKLKAGFPEMASSDCFAAFAGQTKNNGFKQSVNRWTTIKIRQDAENDCTSFRDIYGMDRYPPPLQEELGFPLAFSIVFHKDFDQVLYLLRAVYRPHNVYCLHPDKKSSPEMHAAVKAVVGCLPNVVLASTLEDVVYGGHSRLRADLGCMKDTFKHPVAWQYYINMVGQQFPLKSNLEMVRILKLFNGTNDVEGIIGAGRLERRFKNAFATQRDKHTGRFEMKATGGRNPPPPHNIEVVKGSVFGSFSRAFVRYVLEDPVAIELIRWSRSVYSPDEYVWATLHHSRSLKVPGGNNTGTPDRRRWFNTYANWGSEPCHGKQVRGICIFSSQDLPLLLSRHEFFANKFHIDYHPGALHCLDKLVYSLTVSNTVTDLRFYRKQEFRPGG